MPGLSSSCPLYVWNISSSLQALSYPVVPLPAFWTNAPHCQAAARGQKSNIPQIPMAPGKVLCPLGITRHRGKKDIFETGAGTLSTCKELGSPLSGSLKGETPAFG